MQIRRTSLTRALIYKRPVPNLLLVHIHQKMKIALEIAGSLNMKDVNVNTESVSSNISRQILQNVEFTDAKFLL
jgi:hypothetical protein